MFVGCGCAFDMEFYRSVSYDRKWWLFVCRWCDTGTRFRATKVRSNSIREVVGRLAVSEERHYAWREMASKVRLLFALISISLTFWYIFGSKCGWWWSVPFVFHFYITIGFDGSIFSQVLITRSGDLPAWFVNEKRAVIYALLKSFPDLILMFLLFRAVFSKKGIDKSVCIRSFIYPSDGSSWGLMMLRSQNLLVSLNANNPVLEFISHPVYPLFNIT